MTPIANVPFSAPGAGRAVPVGPGGKPNEDLTAPAVPGVPPHSHGPDGTTVPPPKAIGPAKNGGGPEVP